MYCNGYLHINRHQQFQPTAPDGIGLNDRLLLIEIRDAIREGDGIRVLRCWKFYWRHTKYCLEAFRVSMPLQHPELHCSTAYLSIST